MCLLKSVRGLVGTLNGQRDVSLNLYVCVSCEIACLSNSVRSPGSVKIVEFVGLMGLVGSFDTI
jgi:hypothetical protein